MPTVRSLALAVNNYEIDVKYPGTNFRATPYPERESLSGQQLSFPFLVVSPSNEVSFKLGPVTDNTVAINVQVKRKTG